MKKKVKRSYIQLAAAVITNGYLYGFISGKIYQGKSKAICVPGLNCYSCPGAVGSCPIGAIQSVLGSREYKVTFYIFGTLMLFGVIFGRLVCGFLCPFGLIQDLLYKIKVKKRNLPVKLDQKLRYLKYAMLLFPVILFPVFLTDRFGFSQPYFCKWICPAGTLEGGIPLVIFNEGLRSMVGFLFSWKMGILLVVIIGSVLTYRPFCKYLCPLGACYGLFAKVSFYQMDVDKGKCTGCKACEKNCKMGVRVRDNINSAECIRCGDCQTVCRYGAISAGFGRRSGEKSFYQGGYNDET